VSEGAPLEAPIHLRREDIVTLEQVHALVGDGPPDDWEARVLGAASLDPRRYRLERLHALCAFRIVRRTATTP
jgi:hypothetical protein